MMAMSMEGIFKLSFHVYFLSVKYLLFMFYSNGQILLPPPLLAVSRHSGKKVRKITKIENVKNMYF